MNYFVQLISTVAILIVATGRASDEVINCDEPKRNEVFFNLFASINRVKPRFYFHNDRFMCMQYFPRFGVTKGVATMTECVRRCQPMDGPSCFAGGVESKPVKGASQRQCKEDACDAGYSCRRGAFFPSCCKDDIQEEAYCPVGFGDADRKGLQIKIGEGADGYNLTLYALRCTDLLCPVKHRCFQGKYVAKCCREPKMN